MMSLHPVAHWLLFGAALAAGWFSYGWKGLVLGITAITFWMLLQFSRTLRVMRDAGKAPLGRVGSAVMLHSRLRKGMTLLQILALTGSLGERVDPQGDGTDECWRWTDEGAATVTVDLQAGRLRRWKLERPTA